MCGIIGIISKNRVIDSIYPALIALQHRGQDATGAVTYDSTFHLKKGRGLVTDVFNPKNIARLEGKMGIGHVRYPTIGPGGIEDAQPFIIYIPYGIGIAHNGNLVNFFDLKKEIVEEEFRYLNSNCDAEVILNILSIALTKINLREFSPEILFNALSFVYKKLIGSFAVVCIIAGKGLFAFRDKNGIKPLVYAKNEEGFIFASESVALDLLNCSQFSDVEPGQVIFIDHKGNLFQKKICEGKKAACIFEYVYFARPDSVIDGTGVYEARLRLGKELGEECKKHGLVPDVVIPVPDTARGSAQMVAEVMGVKHREGLIKNRYIHRTFIMPTQEQRIEAVKMKLNPIKSEIKNKKVLLIDDSIVRGNTAKEIIELIRSAGAKKVYFGVYSPPLKYPCFYGIDMQTRGEFIARNKSVNEIEAKIGADVLVYQTIDGLIKGVGNGKTGFCTACFTGKYPTEIPASVVKKIEKDRQKQ